MARMLNMRFLYGGLIDSSPKVYVIHAITLASECVVVCICMFECMCVCYEQLVNSVSQKKE